jgi:LacI family transcriptional regulator
MKRIALVMGLSDFYEHGIARGVVRYAKSRPDWRIFGQGWMFGGLKDLSQWRGDGIIARVESGADADNLAGLGLPVIDVAGAYSRKGFRSMTNDDFLTGYSAARYFGSIGFGCLAFLGVEAVGWSAARKEGAARALGMAVAGIPSFERGLDWWEGLGTDDGDLASFLAGLDRPAAVFACNDTAGLRAVELCGRVGIEVPSEIAVLGVDDEDIVCELASPSLSSVALDCETIGYRAAALLDAVLEGSGPPAGTALSVPPRSVAERESTMTFSTDDPLVAKAVTAIRARAHEGIDVADVLRLVPASRRSLETRFRRATGRSLHEEILLARVGRAKRLLSATDLTMDAVAEASGFGSLQRFHESFKRLAGMTPGAWREGSRRGGLTAARGGDH